MTPKQILDSFSETLIQDERILSPQERDLIATLLQHARAASNENSETEEAVRSVIASAIGETVAQRAFSVLGASIVQRILENGALAMEEAAGAQMHTPEPQPPSTGPGPGVKAPKKEPHQPPHKPPHKPPLRAPEPQPPSTGPGPGVKVPPPTRPPGEPQPPSTGPGPVPKAPQPPNAVRTTTVAQTPVALAERPESLAARCVVLDEFLAPQELEELTRFALEHEIEFSASEVISPIADAGVVNYEHRRSRVLMDLREHRDVLLSRIKVVLPQVLEKLGMEDFAIADIEAQITASNDADFFHFHSDNGSERVASRYLTFVYFFHREPRQFEGGELRIHDARLEEEEYVSAGSYQTIVPEQNQIVFFPCELLHEITPVSCVSQQFADSRFTVNGWLRR